MSRELHMAEWSTANPQTPQQISEFYRTSRHLAGDLDELHNDPRRDDWQKAMFAVFEQRKLPSVLEIGAGGGHDLAALISRFPSLRRVAVEPNDMLRDRLLNNGIVNKAYSDISDVPPEEFRAVMLIDVLEHLVDPEAMVRDAARYVPVGGWLFEATATHNTWTSTHLPQNFGWWPHATLRELGFQLRHTVDYFNAWERVSLTAPRDFKTIVAALYRSSPPHMVQQLLDMQSLGWDILIAQNDALITRVRSASLTRWWREIPSDTCLLVDADIVFTPADAERIVETTRKLRGVVVGAYALRGGHGLSSRVLANTPLRFGPTAQPVEIEYGATGFMCIHRDVFEAMRTEVPLYHATNRDLSFWPVFDPPHIQKFKETPIDKLYLSEDWHFCEFAKSLGFKTYVEPMCDIGHLGEKVFTVADYVETLKEKQQCREMRNPESA